MHDTSATQQVVSDALARLVPDPASPGAALVVVHEGARTVAVRGQASLEHGVPLAPATPMYAASLAKLVTAAAVHRCVAAGRLSLGDTLDRWFPTLRGADRITLAHLLQHRSGLPEYHALRLLAGHHVEDRLVPADVRGLVPGMEPWFEPGSSVSYNNTNYAVLAAVVEATVERPWPSAAVDLVLGPVGAVDGGVRDEPGTWFAGMASCYTRSGDGWRRATLGCTSVGDGGWWASPNDLAALAAALVRGTVDGDDVAGPMRHADPPPAPTTLRSGCTVGGDGQSAWFGGSAEFVGAKAELRVYADAGFAVAAIANAQHLALSSALDEVVEALTGRAPVRPSPAPFVQGPAPDGWFLAGVGGAAWEVRPDRAAVGSLRFDLEPDGDHWCVVGRPSVVLGWTGDHLVVRDGANELARLTPLDVRPATGDARRAAAGVYDCPSARTTVRVVVAGDGLVVGRGDLADEPATVVGVGDDGLVLATDWGSLRLPVDGSTAGRAVLGRAEGVRLERRP